LVDYHGWYAKDRKFIEIIDTNLIAAMSPPGGGKNSISIRLLRHFNIYSIREPDSKNFYMIYSSMMSAYTNMHYDKIEVNSELKSAFNLTVDATYDLYTNIVAHLKPTPAKCHYLFNMRNVSRIYEGMQMAPPELLA
jgi:dynein heavy chain